MRKKRDQGLGFNECGLEVMKGTWDEMKKTPPSRKDPTQ